MKHRLLILLCLAFSLPALAATGLRGIVTNGANNQPVGDASVLLQDQGILVVTDANGSFTISNAQVGTDVLKIMANGYEDTFVDVSIVGGRVEDLGTIKLSESGYTSDSFNAGTDYIFDEMELLDDDSSNQSWPPSRVPVTMSITKRPVTTSSPCTSACADIIPRCRKDISTALILPIRVPDVSTGAVWAA